MDCSINCLPSGPLSLHNIIELCDVCMKYFYLYVYMKVWLCTYRLPHCVCHPQHVVQASTRHMLETLNVQSALRIVSAMEKHLLSAAVRKASSGLRKILQLWLVHVSTPGKKRVLSTIVTPCALTIRLTPSVFNFTGRWHKCLWVRNENIKCIPVNLLTEQW